MWEEYLGLGIGKCLPFYCSSHQGTSPEQCKIHLVPPVSMEFIFWELHETFHILIVARLNLNFELVIRAESLCNEPLNTCWGKGLDHCPKILNINILLLYFNSFANIFCCYSWFFYFNFFCWTFMLFLFTLFHEFCTHQFLPLFSHLHWLLLLSLSTSLH
jgi:hypothetical protein